MVGNGVGVGEGDEGAGIETPLPLEAPRLGALAEVTSMARASRCGRDREREGDKGSFYVEKPVISRDVGFGIGFDGGVSRSLVCSFIGGLEGMLARGCVERGSGRGTGQKEARQGGKEVQAVGKVEDEDAIRVQFGSCREYKAGGFTRRDAGVASLHVELVPWQK
jgi:hypothetical protein